MNSPSSGISAISDISANIFALLLLILIVLLASRAHSPAARSEVLPEIDVEKDLASVERTPLKSEDLFDLLYERRQAASATRIDLLDRAIVVVSTEGTERFDSAQAVADRLQRLSEMTPGAPVGLYVFGPPFYRSVTDSLKALGRPWREISVPEALRDFRPNDAGQNWSPGFTELISRISDRATFRAELAKLLQASSRQDKRDKTATQRQSPDIVFENLARWSRTALHAIALLGGMAFIAWVELQRCRGRYRGPSATPAPDGAGLTS